MSITEHSFLFQPHDSLWLILGVALVDRRILSRLTSVPQIAAAVALLVGSAVFLGGWMLNISILKSLLPGAATMKVNTALGFILSGAALSLLSQTGVSSARRRMGQVCAAFVCLVGVLTLTQYLFGWDFRIDQLLFNDLPEAGTEYPGRMAPATALNFLFIGSSLLLLNERRRFWLPHILAILTALISLTALVGYLYSVPLLYGWSVNFKSIALHTALTFFILSVGILFVHPQRGIMAVVTNDTVGGLMARRLFPAAVVILLVLGWLRLQGERAGFYDAGFGVALMVLSSIVIIGALILWNATLLYQVDTRRKKFEEVLRESETRLRLSVQSANVGLWDWDLTTNEVYFSPEWKSQLGYLDDELPNRFEEWQNRLHPDDLAQTLAKVQRFIEDPAADYKIEYRLRHKDGSWRWIFTQAQVFRNAAGKSIRMMGCHIDITTRKLAEETIKNSEEYVRTILDNIPAFVALFTPDGIILEVNQMPLEGTGLRREEVIGKEFAETYSWNYSPEAQAQIRDAFRRAAKGEIVTGDFRPRMANAVIIECFAVFAPLCDASGTVVQVVGSGFDITERKRVEAQLRERSFLLSESQRIGHIGTWSWELPENHLHWSEETYRIFRVSPQTFVLTPESFLTLIHPDDRASMQDWIRACQSGEKTEALEFRILLPDGDIRILSGHGELLPATDSVPARMIGAVQDITEQRLAQQQINYSNQQLRALSARLQVVRETEGTRIARTIHDELGGALVGLKWDLERLDRMLSEANNAAQRLFAREKISAIMRAIDTTILTVRRISSELRPGVLDDLGLVSAVEWQAQQFHERTGVVCECNASSDEVSLSKDRATAVFRIFQEILTNILRHAQATHVRIKMLEESGYFILEVSDNGRGITEREKSASRSLGLLGMQERAHLIGGEVSIVRGESQGTTVTVRVPLSPVDEEDSAT